MQRTSKIAFYCLLALLLFSTNVYVGNAQAQPERTPQIIDFLINAVAQSHLTFVRNGEKHTCDEAAGHIKQKYDYFRSKIKTPEDFICLCASKSLLSEKPYLVITEEGTIPVASWLEQKLAEYEKSHS